MPKDIDDIAIILDHLSDLMHEIIDQMEDVEGIHVEESRMQLRKIDVLIKQFWG